jgi:uncharacterized membrane protein AbrB (regulator of aidB expression)
LSSVLVLAAASAADLPRVALLAQSVRIFVLVALMPAILSLSGDGTGMGPPAAPVTSTLLEIVVTLAGSAAAAGLLAALNVPGGVLLVAMVASAVLHGAGLVAGRLPPGLLILGFIATGAVIGARFRGSSLASLARTLPPRWAACSWRSPSRPGSRPWAAAGSGCRSGSSGWPTRRVGWRRWR